MDRPRAATTIPVLFLAASLGAGWTFGSRQAAEGTPALHAAAKRLETEIESRLPGGQAQLSKVEVEGAQGRTTFQIAVAAGRPGVFRVAEQEFRWRRAADGRWQDPEAVERPALPTGRRGR